MTGVKPLNKAPAPSSRIWRKINSAIIANRTQRAGLERWWTTSPFCGLGSKPYVGCVYWFSTLLRQVFLLVLRVKSKGLPGGSCCLPKFPRLPMLPQFFLIVSIFNVSAHHLPPVSTQQSHLVVAAFHKTGSSSLVPYDIFPLFPQTPGRPSNLTSTKHPGKHLRKYSLRRSKPLTFGATELHPSVKALQLR